MKTQTLKRIGYGLSIIPLAFLGWTVLVLADGSPESIAEIYALEVTERLIMGLVLLSVLHWYDRLRGYTEWDKLPGNYMAGRVIALSIVLAFGGIG